MRLAAIDIGTNSLHMIVVRVRADRSFEVIDREKEMVRLGAGGLDGRALTPEAMHAALQVMSKFRRLAESHRVDEIIAAATSATREAENGGEFLDAVASAQHGRAADALRSRRISAKQLRRARKEIVDVDLEKRLHIPGLEPRRADLAVAGAILLDTIVRRLGASELTLCDLSLREGLILDYIARHRKQIAQADRYPDVRRRSVVELAERSNYWPEHVNQVARLALALFDQTRAIHGLTDREREWLEYAAILHDIGVHISYERHHKHSYYLIKNGDLRGFEPDEIETIALLTRYHRRATPKRRHDGFGQLRRKRRRAVRALAAMLRLAESLDRSHAQTVATIDLHDRGDDVLLQVRATGDAELEIWAAGRHVEPFERLLGKPLRVE